VTIFDLHISQAVALNKIHLIIFGKIMVSKKASSSLQKRSCFIRKKKLKANEKTIFFFDFVDDVEFCYTGFIRYTNNN
jgi:hypothetical protein